MALIVASLTKIAVEGDSLIENKTFAGPEIMGRINVGQIVQNPAVQLMDMLESSFAEELKCFF
ncbi:MAG TPA: hypothetical protein DIT73_04810, partial [Gammaproteobacteria bacterium]|nr:hypothetical protein [Gammaproteobacteria bacterium]